MFRRFSVGTGSAPTRSLPVEEYFLADESPPVAKSGSFIKQRKAAAEANAAKRREGKHDPPPTYTPPLGTPIGAKPSAGEKIDRRSSDFDQMVLKPISAQTKASAGTPLRPGAKSNGQKRTPKIPLPQRLESVQDKCVEMKAKKWDDSEALQCALILNRYIIFF